MSALEKQSSQKKADGSWIKKASQDSSASTLTADTKSRSKSPRPSRDGIMAPAAKASAAIRGSSARPRAGTDKKLDAPRDPSRDPSANKDQNSEPVESPRKSPRPSSREPSREPNGAYKDKKKGARSSRLGTTSTHALEALVATRGEALPSRRAEQFERIDELLGLVKEKDSDNITPSMRLQAVCMLLQSELTPPDVEDEPESSPISPIIIPNERSNSFVEITGSGKRSRPTSGNGDVLHCATGNYTLGRSRWFEDGIVHIEFCIIKSQGNDGNGLKLGIAAQQKGGGMLDRFTHPHAYGFDPKTGCLWESSHRENVDERKADAKERKGPAESLMDGDNLGKGRANGAVVEVQIDTINGLIQFRITDNKGKQFPWVSASLRGQLVTPPNAFAAFVQITNFGDQVELRSIEHYLPAGCIAEQMSLPPLGVDVEELERALNMPDPNVPQADLDKGWEKLSEAGKIQEMADHGSGCNFIFIDAQKLRESVHEMPRFFSLQDLERKHPDWLYTKMLTIEEVCTTDFTDHLSVSHRWDQPGDPDPKGVQLAEIRNYLGTHPHVKWVWYDYMCMYQSSSPDRNTRSDTEKRQFKAMLKNVNLLYLGCSVLILLDRSYLGRFWTQFEAWLSMQTATDAGLVGAPAEKRRCAIRCVHEAPESLSRSLVQDWCDATAEKAHATLSRPDVAVTNKADKEMQLPKILWLNDRVREVLSMCKKVAFAFRK